MKNRTRVRFLPSPLWGGSRAKRAGWGSKFGDARFVHTTTTPTPALRADLSPRADYKGEGKNSVRIASLRHP